MSSAPELVLVTGATGFIGSNIVASLLSKGVRVRGTVRDVKSPKNSFLYDLKGADFLELVATTLDRYAWVC
jgi:uncharacterized protein YbjT (DUF2867 family)